MASEEEIIHALEDAVSPAVKIRILDQLGSKIKPQHRDLISHLVTLSRQEQNQEVAYSVKRALFKIRSRYNITNFPLFLMDPIRLLQSSDPACRVKALEVFEKGEVSVEQCYHFLGSLFFENDPFVLSRMMKITPILCGFIPSSRVETILEDFLDSQDSRVRANVVEALGTIRQRRSEESFERLWSCLKDPDQRVRANATSQILEDPPEGLNEFMKECMEVSQDYYELLSCKAMLRDGAIEFEEQVHEQLEKRLKKLEALLPLEEETQIAGIGMEDEGRERLRRGPMNLSLVSFFFRSQRSVWILSIFVVLSIYGYRTHQSNQALVKWNLNLEQSANKLKKNVLALKEQLQKQNSEIPIALREISNKEKLNQFREEGSSLRQNADLFMKRARDLFEKEQYSEASILFRSLYEVYKDNRLAVDSVRWLSKTQKIENVLRSVNEYLRKNQFISAKRKLEELRHLVSSQVYENHLRRIETLKVTEKDKK